MRLLVSGGESGFVLPVGDGADVFVDLAGDVAFEAADRFSFREPVGGAPFDVGDRGCVFASDADHDDGPERGVGLAVGVAPFAWTPRRTAP